MLCIPGLTCADSAEVIGASSGLPGFGISFRAGCSRTVSLELIFLSLSGSSAEGQLTAHGGDCCKADKCTDDGHDAAQYIRCRNRSPNGGVEEPRHEPDHGGLKLDHSECDVDHVFPLSFCFRSPLRISVADQMQGRPVPSG